MSSGSSSYETETETSDVETSASEVEESVAGKRRNSILSTKTTSGKGRGGGTATSSQDTLNVGDDLDPDDDDDIAGLRGKSKGPRGKGKGRGKRGKGKDKGRKKTEDPEEQLLKARLKQARETLHEFWDRYKALRDDNYTLKAEYEKTEKKTIAYANQLLLKDKKTESIFAFTNTKMKKELKEGRHLLDEMLKNETRAQKKLEGDLSRLCSLYALKCKSYDNIVKYKEYNYWSLAEEMKELFNVKRKLLSDIEREMEALKKKHEIAKSEDEKEWEAQLDEMRAKATEEVIDKMPDEINHIATENIKLQREMKLHQENLSELLRTNDELMDENKMYMMAQQLGTKSQLKLMDMKIQRKAKQKIQELESRAAIKSMQTTKAPRSKVIEPPPIKPPATLF
eukprot:Nk52_evm10s2152 gene=Nk52_evmTU10s2152